MIAREKVLRLGEQRSLVGILTEPAAGAARADAPAVLLLNAGLLHRIGPNRLHVRLARDLAALGVTTLRLDLAGLGDSLPRRDTLSFEESAALEARLACDALAGRGHRHIVVGGLCSGADNALHAALADERIVGVVLIEGFAYRTRGFQLRYWGERLLSARKWAALARRLARARSAGAGEPEGVGALPYVREFPPRSTMLADLRRLTERGTELLMLHSAGQYTYFNYANQFHDAFPELCGARRIAVRFNAAANHVFSRPEHQRWLIDEIVAWYDSRYPAAPLAAVPATQPAAPTARAPSSAPTPMAAPAATAAGHLPAAPS